MKQKAAATLLVLSLSAGLVSTVQADSAPGDTATSTASNTSGVSSAVTSKTASTTGQALPALTLKQAVEWAQTNNYNTRSTERDVERRRIEFKNAEKDLGNAYLDLIDGEYVGDEVSWRNYNSSTLSYLASKKQALYAKDQLYFNAMKTYQSVFVAENQVKNDLEALEIAQAEEKIALAKFARGKLSEYAKNESVQARSQAQQTVEQSKTALQKARDALNFLMGQPNGSVYELVDRPIYKEPKKLDIEVHIQQLMDMNPNLWKLEDNIKTSELNVRYFDFNSGAGAYDLAKLDVDTAKEELDKGQKDFAESLRNLYATFKDNQKKYVQLEESLITAKEGLELSRKKWARGLIIELELKNSQLKVDQIERQMEELAIELNQNEYTLNKPWST
ncbi:TolC family protein [Paenibacillus kribbensis]|uniref:TolC family protein n=1 Tax=Paenibacillus TaxID=44249 RepID=UPI00024EFC57|nr:MULTISPECIES: TolC family protein [Paenibacillus]EHS57396.1 copper amine oxidase domain protein [Paenibacillus sp. Aloe-11]MEC0236446.1 TolC family protein [Paenibacillus kribbensis]